MNAHVEETMLKRPGTRGQCQAAAVTYQDKSSREHAVIVKADIGPCGSFSTQLISDGLLNKKTMKNDRRLFSTQEKITERNVTDLTAFIFITVVVWEKWPYNVL